MNGWITPTKKFIKCGIYEHIETIINHIEFLQNNKMVQELQEDVDNAHDICQSLVDHGDHGEWHHFEMTLDGAQDKIRNILLNEGYIRVGSWDNYMHFEGSPEAIKSLYQKCKDFAEDHGKQPKFEPQRVN